ncbi:MAG: DNA-processing protein DprA [Phycisphaeraceae bacterium]
MDEAESNALLTLMITPGLGHGLIGRCIDRFGCAAATLSATTDQLKQIDGISSTKAAQVRRDLGRLADGTELAQERQWIERVNATLLTLEDPGYPKLLRLIPDPPRLLYVRGQLQDEDALALAVVGSRQCTHYGREQAERLSFQCAQAGLCIVSGGAYGIDAAAHRAALRAGGRTIVVVGSGLAEPYPDRHAELYDQIADGRGAVLSEFPMTTPPIPENFPRRNRVISGLSLGVLVVEAASRSGALITARLCVEEHGREVMAVPGRVDSPTSAGCHKIIREGWATLVTNAADILDALGDAGQLLKAGVSADAALVSTEVRDPPPLFTQNLSDSQRRIVEALDETRGVDQLAAATGLKVSVVQSDLTMLQIRGLVQRRGGRFARKR